MSGVIKATDLSAGYPGRVVWSKANFSIEPESFVGLLGANGTGKTTLMRLILGLNRPLSGQLKVFGKTPKRGNSRIGYIPQHRLVETETKIAAIEYVRLGLIGTKFGFSSIKQAAAERTQAEAVLAMVGASELAYKPINELSGGEAQRVFLAQALIGKPDLLLLDEPLANLDIRWEVELVRLISNLVKENKLSVILIAHDINPLITAVNQIIYIANGKVASGKPNEVINSKSLSALYNAPIEVLHDSHGRLAVLGIEEAAHHE